jgi:hypothetical protein
MNVIDSNKLEHDVIRKPLGSFRHHARTTNYSAPVATGQTRPLSSHTQNGERKAQI